MKQKIKFPMLFVFLALSIYSCINDKETCDCVKIIITQCDHEDENEESTICERLIGEWVEVEEGLLIYDDFIDTIVFTRDGFIEKHFFYGEWKYEVTDCEETLFSLNDDTFAMHTIEFVSDEKIIIHNFRDRTIASVIKNISFVKQ